ncbi:MAG TPA: FAD-binding and (Fe-S)-binding domain-containing protein [Thermoanaerobaculia bacterium]|jgi:FAD/FMN-containing dehydrogenase/Fe-S oxidoreductase|nr:FAD-binding and (Fe-S)-binding domain-containing protein [Thermoanaerobaculia bacterium]
MPEPLEADLRRAVRGEVRFDAGSRALYATDASNYRQVPIGVVLPRDTDDVLAAVEICRRHGAPLLGRGAGTSLAGQACNVAVVLDFTRHLNRILEIDPERRIARVEPGVVLDDLRREAGKHALTFGPDPATHAWCTLGGMIGNNSCGAHSLTTGRTSDNVEELDVLTYGGLRLRVGATSEEEIDRLVRAGGRRGEIYGALRTLRDCCADLIRERFPVIPRRVSGYNLDELLPEHGFHVARALAGTEGTCVTFLEATVRLVPLSRSRTLLVLGYPDVFAAADHVMELLEAGPLGLEGMDRFLVENDFTRHSYREVLAGLPPGGAWLLAEFELAETARRLAARLPGALVIEDPAGQAAVWSVREAAVGTTSRDPRLGDAWPGWEDAAVPPARLSSYLREFQALLGRFGYGAALYGHFGEGCLHARINFDLASPDGVKRYRAFLEEAADLVASHGGSLSGEHGDGQGRAELLPRMFGEEICRAFQEFKSIWDPDGRMNPGKVVDPLPFDADLRLRTPLREPDFSRCVGVGRCRRDGGGVMCPSWQVTHEEKHSTRGRARLLFEMLSGEVITDGWRSEEVREALDLCLSCKGCKSDCPAGVDMAAYKAEFLYRYYQGRRRPNHAYAVGLIHRWSRLASLAPGLANLLGRTAAVKRLAGIDPRRTLPAFAPRTFRSWFARHKSREGGTPVLLWPDTFTNHFQPEIGIAAVRVLERAGFRVTLPRSGLCCGRPLYDVGMLDLARRQSQEILDALPEGVPIVGLEPSCVAVFRDEMGDRIRMLTLAELLEQPSIPQEPILVQPHCHHHAVMGLEADRRLLGANARFLEGCCGMAGGFGFSHYEVSMACAERVLLLAVREAPEAILLADGFSCREQIRQATGRRALHLAELLDYSARP